MAASPSTLFHLWNNCNHCGASPIFGTRYECTTCPIGPDSDYCQDCYTKLQAGEFSHPSPDNFLAAELKDKTHHFTSYQGAPPDDMAAWFEVPGVNEPAPVVSTGSVVRPEFCAGFQSTFAGYAFVARVEGYHTPLLLTALHVMDEMIKKKGIDATGNNTVYTGRELPQVITKVNLYDVFADNWMVTSLGEAGPMLVLPGARIKDEEPISDRDIAAFKITAPVGLHPLEAAEEPPEVGEPIWLAANRGRGQASRTVPAVVVARTDRSLVFRFMENKVPGYTSGAPLLNALGRFVGINVGGGDYRDHHFGHANHVLNIKKHLNNALY